MSQGANPRPVVLTRLFGREPATAELIRIVDGARLLTLVGAPGCGKSRLGLEVAGRLADRGPARVCVVELAALSDPSLAAPAVAAALGIDDRPNRSAEDGLLEELAAAELLMVLDNCEHLLGAIAALVARLLAACPSLRVLATSRRPLNLAGEQVWRVPPLGAGPAVELFTDRARQAAPGGSIDSSSVHVVEQICRRLDGLPLAIELAASWSRVLTPAQILARLDLALPLLRGRARDARPRQATMEATVDWSCRLLQPAERRLFDRLSMFAGGFDLEAAQAVAPGEDVLSGLASLVDHSLVLAEPVSERMRYRLLEPVRQCAEARLAARGDRDVTRRHHAEHYLDVARRSDAKLRSDEAGAVLARLEEEDGNFRVALAWARAQSDDLGLRLCTALTPSWALRGRVNEGRAWMDEMLRLRARTADQRLRARALAAASRLAWRQRDHPSTRAHLEESLAIERQLGDALGVGRRLRSLAVVAMARGDLDEAERLGEQSVCISREHGDRDGLGLAITFLGMTLQLAGATDRADPCPREALDPNRGNRNITTALYGLGSMSFGAIAAGDIGSLRVHMAQIAALLRTLDGQHEGPGWLWWTAAALASGEDRYCSALRLAGAAGAVARRDGLDLHERLWRQVLPWLDRARSQVGPTRADQLSIEGAQLTPDQLLDEALGESDHARHGPLSPRELEIADLVGQGMTNAEIAERLVISRRTVESHVDHIKAKLGFSRRARIVAWVLDRASDRAASPRERRHAG